MSLVELAWALELCRFGVSRNGKRPLFCHQTRRLTLRLYTKLFVGTLAATALSTIP